MLIIGGVIVVGGVTVVGGLVKVLWHFKVCDVVKQLHDSTRPPTRCEHCGYPLSGSGRRDCPGCGVQVVS